jgi:hypothetical protein
LGRSPDKCEIPGFGFVFKLSKSNKKLQLPDLIVTDFYSHEVLLFCSFLVNYRLALTKMV